MQSYNLNCNRKRTLYQLKVCIIQFYILYQSIKFNSHIGVEGSQWRDKVRNAEAEVEKFKTDIADKLKKLQDLQKQVATYSQDISLKESKLSEAQDLIKKVIVF